MPFTKLVQIGTFFLLIQLMVANTADACCGGCGFGWRQSAPSTTPSPPPLFSITNCCHAIPYLPMVVRPFAVLTALAIDGSNAPVQCSAVAKSPPPRPDELTKVHVIELEEMRGISYSPDGLWLAVTSTTKTELWDTKSWSVRHIWELPGTAVAFSPNGHLLAIAQGVTSPMRQSELPQVPVIESAIILVDIETGDVVRRVAAIPAHDYSRPLTFTPNGNHCVLLSASGIVQVFDTTTWELQRSWPCDFAPGSTKYRESPRILAISRDGKCIHVARHEVGDRQSSLKCWDLTDGAERPLTVLNRYTNNNWQRITDIDFLPDNTIQIQWRSGRNTEGFHSHWSSDGTTTILDTAPHYEQSVCLAYSADNTVADLKNFGSGTAMRAGVYRGAYLRITGCELDQFERGPYVGTFNDKPPYHYTPQVFFGEALQWHPSKRQIACISSKNTLNIYTVTDR